MKNYIRNIMMKIKKEHGVVAMEFALIAPVIAFIGLGIFEFCRYMWYQDELVHTLNTGIHYLFSEPKGFNDAQNVMKSSSMFANDANYIVNTPQCSCAVNATDSMSWQSCSISCGSSQREYTRLSVTYNNFKNMFSPFVSLIPTTLNESTIVRIQ